MDLIEAMATTNACRYYKTDPVSDELIVKVLNGARWAPSGSNKQPVTFLVVRDAAKRQALHDLYQPIWDGVMAKYASGEIVSGFNEKTLSHVDYFARHFAEIPVMVVVCARLGEITAIDANLDRLSVAGGSSIYPAVQNLLLAARNEGLGTTLTTLLCIAEKEIKALLDIPEAVHTTAIVTLGWPEKPFPKKLRRRPLNEIAFLDSYGDVMPGTDL